MPEFLTPFIVGLSLLDVIAVCCLVACWAGVSLLIEHPMTARPSTSRLMAGARHAWMLRMTQREQRMFDGNVLGTMRQGTSFFASSCIISIGGCVALLGSAEQITSVAVDLSGDPSQPRRLWEIRILLVMLFLTNGFLKFVWAHRLFGYAAIVMAATPNERDHPEVMTFATQAADISNSAARSFNRGLRSVYFAIASLAWMLGPVALLLASGITVWVLLRREFWSQTHQALSQLPPLDPPSGQG